MPEFNPGPDFIKQKYDKPTPLHLTPEVEAASKRKKERTGETISQKPTERIQNYLDRLENVFNPPKLEGHPDFDRQKRNAEMLKKTIYDRYVTKLEDVPDGYLEKQLRDRGLSGDYSQADEQQKTEMKEKNLVPVLRDQQASLEQWVDYFASSDSNYIPTILKYWVFREVTSLQEYDKDAHKFPKREQEKNKQDKKVNITVNKFPDLNQEALGYVIDAIVKKYQGKSPEFEYDIQQEERENFEKYLNSENFAKLYAWSIELINPIPEHLLKPFDGKIEGEWKKYQKGSNHRPLVDSIRRKGTGWCTAGENTARTQLDSGDFYVFYSLDDDKKPTIPRIAIRMEEDNIGEIRGIGYKQNLDPYIDNTDVLKNKLNEKNRNGESAFPDKDEYLKKDHDMRMLTNIEKKTKANRDLTKEDLIFLYEIDSIIEGFGYQKDPRIEEIRGKRNINEDAATVLDCKPEEIVRSQEELIKKEINGEKIKAYIGPLFQSIFQKDIEHIYTKFPEGKIRKSELEIGGQTKQELEKHLVENKINISDYALDMLHNKDFAALQNKEQIQTVRLKVRDLGFPSGATTDQIYAKAADLGLELCPAEVGPYMRLKDSNQPKGEWYYIAMKQILDRGSDPNVFDLRHRGRGLWVDDDWAIPGRRWLVDSEFVFRLRQVSQES